MRILASPGGSSWSTASGTQSLGAALTRALLSDLTLITIGSLLAVLVLVVLLRFLWRRGKHVEEP
jgi:hypothetical protein